jgi:hypothetical protein
MDEPRDDIDTWLEERVTPLLPHPGTFERIRRRARRRKAARAALTAAGVVVVLAGAITVPRVILSGSFGGQPTALSSSSTPVQRSSPSPAGSAQTRTSRPDTASPTPTAPSLPAVPSNFAASSVTFVSIYTGWVIGQAGTPGHCGPPKAYDCTSVAITNDGGRTWHGSHAPVTGAPNGGTGAGQIRSLDGTSAWAFGPQLYATHDGGQTWAHIPTHGMRVIDLETVSGMVYAVWAKCASTGTDFAAGCTTFSLYSSPAGHDDWSPVPAATGLQASGGSPGSAQLVLTGTAGYLMTPGGQLFSGPVTIPASWRTVTTPAGIPVALPCAPGAAETGGHPLQAMLASTGTGTGPGLALLCAGQATGDRQAKTLYYSADGGRTWSPAGPAPARGIAMSLSGTLTGPVLVATSHGIDLSTNAPGTSGALTWRTAQGATAPGGYSYVGMTTPGQGVAVPVNVNLDAVWFTYDGGAHWVESPVR